MRTAKRPPLIPAKRRKTTTANADTVSRRQSNPNPNPNSDLNSGKGKIPTVPISLSQEDVIHSRTKHLTRHEVLRRRSHNLKQLIRCYKDFYWALAEDVKKQHRVYYWRYGVSPFAKKRQQQPENAGTEGETGEVKITANCVDRSVSRSKGGVLDLKEDDRCLAGGCKSKAMALTNFCHFHILSDSEQKLYKPCNYVTSVKARSRMCGKPILRSTVSSLCVVHYQRIQRDVLKTLKSKGLSAKVAQCFHVLVANYVREIQKKRRNAQEMNKNKVVDMDE